MNNGMKLKAQGGFTLIELMVVIVILGILAATALPKFASLSGDARAASLQAARGAMAATSAMAHGKALIKPSITTLTVENVEMTMKDGYPAGDTPFARAAGLAATDYKVTAADGIVTVVPLNVTAAIEGTCFVRYTQAANLSTPPVFTQDLSKCE